MSLTYLLASLPFLQLGSPPPVAPEELLRRAQPVLSPPELLTLKDLLETGGRHAEHPFARAWRALETQLRNAVATARAQRLKRLPDPWLKPFPGVIRLDIRNAVEEAFQSPSPLERERKLDRSRWILLDELAGHDPFTLDTLFAYALRLRMVARWAALRPETGETVLHKEIERLFQSLPLSPISGTPA